MGDSLSLSPYSPNYGKPCKKQFYYTVLLHSFIMLEPTGPGGCDVSDQIQLACFDIVVCHTDQVKGDMCCISTYDDQRNLVPSN